MNWLLLLRAFPFGFFRQDLRRGTGARIVAAHAAPASGSGIADHSIDDQPHNDSKKYTDDNRRDHPSLSPLLLPVSMGCPPSAMV